VCNATVPFLALETFFQKIVRELWEISKHDSALFLLEIRRRVDDFAKWKVVADKILLFQKTMNYTYSWC
jgi:hypothetical protein